MQNLGNSLRHNPEPCQTSAPITATPDASPLNVTLQSALATPPITPATSSELQPSDDIAGAHRLISPLVRERRFRVDSFMAKLTLEQRDQVCAWLSNNDETIDQVCARIAAPAPAGFGLQVQRTTLSRLKKLIQNAQLNHWIENAMDVSCDILDQHAQADVTTIRESMSLLLYSRAMTNVRQQADPAAIEKLLRSITHLEKLKTHVARRHVPRHSAQFNIPAINVTIHPSAHAPKAPKAPKVPATVTQAGTVDHPPGTP